MPRGRACNSPYEACVVADNDPMGTGWWLEISKLSEVRVYNVLGYGPDWVQLQRDPESLDDKKQAHKFTSFWARWDHIQAPFRIVSDGVPVTRWPDR